MRAASDSLLRAIERTDVGEDRLTEVLACVASVHSDLAAALIRMAGGETRRGERYAVGTQRVTPGGRRVDMEIATYTGLVRTGLLWIEIKEDAIYQPNQLSDYADQVRDPVFGEPNGKLLTVIPPDYRRPQLDSEDPPRWRSKNWSDVALEADRLGRAWARADDERSWLHAAMRPGAPARWRYLAELVRHLEQKGYARMEPLTPEDVIAAPRVVTLPKTFEALIKAVRDGIAEVTREPKMFKRYNDGCFQIYAPAAPKWFSDPDRFGNAYPELQYWYRDGWLADPREAPAFFAGITFNEIADHTRSALQDQEWQKRLPQGVTVGGEGRLLRVVRTKYLSQLIVEGVTFDQQAEALRLWGSHAMTDIMDRVEPPQVTAGARI